VTAGVLDDCVAVVMPAFGAAVRAGIASALEQTEAPWLFLTDSDGQFRAWLGYIASPRQLCQAIGLVRYAALQVTGPLPSRQVVSRAAS